jgi:hypothetical protein
MADQTREVGIKLTFDGKQAEKSVGQMKTELGKANKELADAVKNFGELSDEVKQAEEQVKLLNDELKQTGDTADDIGNKPTFTPLKKQLKDAQIELQKMQFEFGEFSTEAIQAAKRVGELKDQIDDTKGLVDAFNPEAKFRAFGGALQGVVGGFTALQGGLALAGVESEETQKALLKVQGALALSQGIDSVLESVDAFKRLGAVLKSFTIIQKLVTAGQYLWNLAVSSNPIGALVVAITALIAGGVALVKFFQNSSKEAKANEQAIKNNSKALKEQTLTYEKNSKELDRNQKLKLDLAKANGESTKAIRELELKLIDEKIAFAQASRETARNTLEKNKNALATLKANGASDELIKKQKEVTDSSLAELNKQTDNLNNATSEKKDIINKQSVEVVAEQKKANDDAKKKREEDNKDRADKAKEAREKAKQDEQALAKELKTLQDELFLLTIKDETERAKKRIDLDLKSRIEAINATKASEETKRKLIEEEEKKADGQKKTLDEEKQKKILDQEEKFQIELSNAVAQNRINGEKDARVKELLALEETAFQKRQTILNNETTTSEQKKLLIAQALIEEQRQKIELEEKFAKEDATKKIAKLEEIAKDTTLAKETRLQAITDEENLLKQQFEKRQILEEEYNKKVKQLSQDRINIDIAEKEAKAQIVGQIGDIASGLVNLLKQTNEKSKGLAIAALIVEQAAAVAKIIANTQVANAKSIAASPLTGGQPFVAINTISAGLSIASAVASVVKGIQQIKSASPSGGGGGGGAAPSVGGGGGAVVPPLPPQQEQTLLNQGQVNEIGSATSRAYVVESDVSGNQERIQRINRAARIS